MTVKLLQTQTSPVTTRQSPHSPLTYFFFHLFLFLFFSFFAGSFVRFLFSKSHFEGVIVSFKSKVGLVFSFVRICSSISSFFSFPFCHFLSFLFFPLRFHHRSLFYLPFLGSLNGCLSRENEREKRMNEKRKRKKKDWRRMGENVKQREG